MSSDDVLSSLKKLDDNELFEYIYKLKQNYNRAVVNNSISTIESLKPILRTTEAYIEMRSLSEGGANDGFILS